MRAPALVSIIAACVLTACGAPPPTAPTAPATPLPARTAIATLAPHPVVEQLSGTVRAGRAATLQARVPATVARLAAEPGATVAAGVELIGLDAAELLARRDQAQAAARLAAADRERVERAAAVQGTIARTELDEAQARAVAAAAQAAEADVLAGYLRVTAPFAGVVVRRHVAVGDLVAPGRPLIDLEDPASLRLEIEVPESLAARIAPTTTLRVLVPAAELDAEAAVAEVIPAADPVSRSVLVKLALPAAPGLRSGQFGRAAIAVADGQALTVPAAAVVRRGQLDLVTVVADGRATLRLVRLGGTVGDRVVVRAGLAAGEVVGLEDAPR
jgi:RND family efflux transporter MFP subunit